MDRGNNCHPIADRRESALSSFMNSIEQKRAKFHELHRSGCFVLPNPWDIGSARFLEHLGFKALATTSAGLAFSRGRPDNGVARDEVLAHLRELVEATDVPINADYENGYADDRDGVAENVRLCVAAGVAGLSIEDSTGSKEQPLYDLAHAVERIHAARTAIGDSGALLVGRAECFLVGRTDIDEVIRRLTAYAQAGADCLYAPGVQTREHISALVAAVAPKPLNVLISGTAGLTTAEAAALGVRRVSVGGALARVAWGSFIRAAHQLADEGSFDGFAGAAPHGELNDFFRKDQELRSVDRPS
jgi:2-methylisocitrate lyase-like PEP mutase family enzyme